eukprot:TRINITY_DN5755_c0_g1_i4.p1 TRINITY_DN5755_c0_g1~~TRINITY_DN5755_c0_g1_i4.p1  ORF type:complete len:1497 (-),score=451.25 TRINITY_DN5755_c0_g1_i4:1720-6210(-)
MSSRDQQSLSTGEHISTVATTTPHMTSKNVISALGKSPVALGAAAVIGVSASMAISYWIFSKKYNSGSNATRKKSNNGAHERARSLSPAVADEAGNAITRLSTVSEDAGGTSVERIMAKLERLINEKLSQTQNGKDTSQELLFLYRKILALLTELEELRNSPPTTGGTTGYSELKDQLAVALQEVQMLKAEKYQLQRRLDENMSQPQSVQGFRRSATPQMDSLEEVKQSYSVAAIQAESNRNELRSDFSRDFEQVSRDRSHSPDTLQKPTAQSIVDDKVSDHVHQLETEVEKLRAEKRILENLRDSASSTSENLTAQGKRLLDRIKQLQEDVDRHEEEAKQKEEQYQKQISQQEETIDKLRRDLKNMNAAPAVEPVVVMPVIEGPVPSEKSETISEEMKALQVKCAELEDQNSRLKDEKTKSDQLIREHKDEIDRGKLRFNSLSQQFNEALELVTQREKDIVQLQKELQEKRSETGKLNQEALRTASENASTSKLSTYYEAPRPAPSGAPSLELKTEQPQHVRKFSAGSNSSPTTPRTSFVRQPSLSVSGAFAANILPQEKSGATAILERRIEELNSKLNESQSTLQKKEQALSELEKQLNQLKKVSSSDKDSIDRMQADLSSSKRKLDSLEDDLRKATIELTGNQRSLQERELEVGRLREEIRRLESLASRNSMKSKEVAEDRLLQLEKVNQERIRLESEVLRLGQENEEQALLIKSLKAESQSSALKLQAEQEKNRSAFVSLEGRIVSLSQDLAKSADETVEWRQKYRVLVSQTEVSDSSRRELENLMNNLKSEKALMTSELGMLSDRATQAEKELSSTKDALKSKSADLMRMRSEMESLKSQKAELQEKEEESEAKMKKMQVEFIALKDEALSTKNNLSKVLIEVESLKAERSMLRNQVSELTTNLQSARSSIQEANDNLELETRHKEQQKNAFEEEIRSLKGQIALLDKKLVGQKSMAENTYQVKSELEMKIGEMENQIVILQKSKNELARSLELSTEESRNLRATLKENTQNYQIEVESLKSNLRSQSGKNLELMQEVDSVHRNFKMTNAELEKALADKEKLKISLSDLEIESQQSKFKLDAVNAEKDALLEKLKKMGKDVDRYQQESEALILEVKALNESKRKTEQLLEGLQQKEGKYLEKIQELTNECARVSQQLTKSDGDLRSLKQMKIDMEAQFAEEMRRLRSEVESNAKDHSKEAETLRSQFTQAQQEIVSLSKNVATLQSELNSSREFVKERDSALSAFREKEEKFSQLWIQKNQELENLSIQLQESQATLENTQLQMQDMTEKGKAMLQELSDIADKLEAERDDALDQLAKLKHELKTIKQKEKKSKEVKAIKAKKEKESSILGKIQELQSQKSEVIGGVRGGLMRTRTSLDLGQSPNSHSGLNRSMFDLKSQDEDLSKSLPPSGFLQTLTAPEDHAMNEEDEEYESGSQPATPSLAPITLRASTIGGFESMGASARNSVDDVNLSEQDAISAAESPAPEAPSS